jgi:hypothetical protein
MTMAPNVVVTSITLVWPVVPPAACARPADGERALGRVRQQPACVGARRRPELERRAHDRLELAGVRLHLDLAEMRHVREADVLSAARPLGLLAVEARGHLPAVAGLEHRACRPCLALHRAARHGVGSRGQEVEAHERSTSPSGS